MKGGESSKPGSQQSTARNIPKGSITFHNKAHEKEYNSKNSNPKTTKPKKEHPTFFEVKPSHINLDKQSARNNGKNTETKQSFVNFLNKAPLPKPQPCLIQKQESCAQSETTITANVAVSSLLQQNKTISHTLHSLLSELKSLFFYEESSTLRD